MTGRKTIPVLLFLVLTLVGGHAQADRLEAAALRMGKAAEDLFLAGRHRQALNLFEKLVRRFNRPPELIDAARWNIGRCHEEMGNDEQALIAFIEYAKRAELDDQRTDIFDKLRSIRERLRASVVVRVLPEDAEVLVDGEPVAVADLAEPLRMGFGRRVITVSRRGFLSQELLLELAPKEVRSLTIALVEAPQAESAATDPREAPVVAQSVGGDWSRMKIAGVATLSVGGLVAVAGIVPLVLAYQDSNAIRDMKSRGLPSSCELSGTAPPASACPYMTDLKEKSLRQRMRSRVGYALEGVGAAASIAGAVLLVLDSRRPDARQVGANVIPVRHGIVAGISGVF